MWAQLKVSKINHAVKKELREARKSLNINEEYLSALRTKSYADFFIKAQSHVNQHQYSSPSCCHHSFSESLLEPGQEAIRTILDSALILSKSPQLKILMLDFFNISAEASQICIHLLKSINQIMTNHIFMQRVLNDVGYPDQLSSLENVKLINAGLNLFIVGTMSVSKPNKHDFKVIRDKYSYMLRCLNSMRKNVVNKMKLINCFNKASGIFITAACGLVVVAAMVLAGHTFTALFMGPALLSVPFKRLLKKLSNLPFLRSGVLKKVGYQLDLAAKGTYILNRDFDMMSRLVARLHDALEHYKGMIKSCLGRRELKFRLQVIKELKKGDFEFRKQLEEVQEHVYLCLVTINKARAFVIKEMIHTTCVEELALIS